MLIDVTINVKNMTCPACETKLNNKLSMLEGVKKAHANFNTGTIQVEYDDELVALSDINGTIIKAGYELGKKLNANKTLFIVYLSISAFLLISLLLIKILTNWGILSLVSF
jgi:copper chaperone CopZ